MEDIIFYSIGLIISVVTFVFGRYVFPKLKTATLDSDNEFIKAISTWVYDFVVDAKNTLGDSVEGSDKKEWVSEKIENLLDSWGVNLSSEQISALIEAAYDKMKLETATIPEIITSGSGEVVGSEEETK